VWIGFFPGFLLVSCMDAVTFTAVKTRRTMTVFLLVVIVPFLMTVFVGIAKVRRLPCASVSESVPVLVPVAVICLVLATQYRRFLLSETDSRVCAL
jgi:hypothetical protein